MNWVKTFVSIILTIVIMWFPFLVPPSAQGTAFSKSINICYNKTQVAVIILNRDLRSQMHCLSSNFVLFNDCVRRVGSWCVHPWVENADSHTELLPLPLWLSSLLSILIPTQSTHYHHKCAQEVKNADSYTELLPPPLILLTFLQTSDFCMPGPLIHLQNMQWPRFSS